jgi:aminoglycoside phosphotransferase
MSKTPPEQGIPLSGGNVTTSVLRVGETVRRAQTRHSKTVRRLLRHLERKGYPYSPRFLGVDDQGRDCLTFLPGEVDRPQDLWHSDDALNKAGKMLRAYHDATLDWEPHETDSWAHTHTPSERNEVIGHNDFAPYNMIFAGGLPVGVIDFDLAGPAPRHRDLAYLAYWSVPLSFASPDMKELAVADLQRGSARLKHLCASYGTEDLMDVLDMVLLVLMHMSSQTAAARMIGTEAAHRLERGGHFDHWAKEANAFETQMEVLKRSVI